MESALLMIQAYLPFEARTLVPDCAAAPAGAIAALRRAIEDHDERRWPELYQAIHVTGMGAAAAGLTQRLKAEFRQLRAEPGMPRTVRPALASPPPLDLPTNPETAAARGWPLSAGELAAWAGAARRCTGTADEPSCWAVASRFERGALSTTVQAAWLGSGSG